MKYKYLQLKASGVELISRIDDPKTELPDSIVLHRPAQILMNKEGLVLNLWLPWAPSDEGITILSSEFLIVTNINEEMIKYYEDSIAMHDRIITTQKSLNANPRPAFGKDSDFGSEDIGDEFLDDLESDGLSYESLEEDVDALSDLASAFGPGQTTDSSKANVYDQDDRSLSEVMNDLIKISKIGKKN